MGIVEINRKEVYLQLQWAQEDAYSMYWLRTLSRRTWEVLRIIQNIRWILHKLKHPTAGNWTPSCMDKHLIAPVRLWSMIEASCEHSKLGGLAASRRMWPKVITLVHHGWSFPEASRLWKEHETISYFRKSNLFLPNKRIILPWSTLWPMMRGVFATEGGWLFWTDLLG